MKVSRLGLIFATITFLSLGAFLAVYIHRVEQVTGRGENIPGETLGTVFGFCGIPTLAAAAVAYALGSRLEGPPK